jgi:transposase
MLYHLPFEVEKTRFSKQALHGKNRNIELGVDLGLKHFAVLSIMDKSNIKAPKEIMRYFIGQGQLFDMKFSTNTGKFELQERKTTNIKLKLIHLRSEITHIQHKLHTYQNRLVEKGVSNFKMKFKYNHLKTTLSQLWIKISNINREIVNLLQHTILTIATYYNVSMIKCENLKWARHTKRSQVGAYLAFWQTHWFYSQVQEGIHLQATRNNREFKQVDARNTSKRCSKCNTIGTRTGKAFFCPDCSITIDSDLNAGRNIVLCPC